MTVGRPPGPWLVGRGIVKRYGGVTALAGVDLELHAGTMLGLIGPNGAGKSTLSKVLAGVVRRSDGSVEIDGEVVDFPTPAAAQARGLVMMPQEIAILPNSTVIDNVTLGSEPTQWGIRDPRASRAETLTALEAVGLDVDPRAIAGDLVPAHQRMLMMARAVHRKARLLILDEPTAGLAEHEASLVVEAVRRLMDRDLTVVYVSHHLSEIASLCHRVVCVREARIQADLSGSEVTRPALVTLISGTPELSEPEAPSPTVEVSEPEAPSPSAEGIDPQEGVALRMQSVSGRRLADVTFDASPGEVLGVTGLLGSGVSELVSFLVGAAKPATGSYELGGTDMRFRSPADATRHGIGYLPGDRGRAAFAGMAIRENVSLPALSLWFGRLGLISRRRERSSAREALRALSVTANQEQPISSLSGGNQQRALVARLIAAESRILVLDEPTVGVDIRARAELWGALRHIARSRTVIVASSDPEELEALADRVVCIRHGRVARVLAGAAVTATAITEAIA